MTNEIIQGASIVYGQLEIFNQVDLGPYQVESFTINIELEGFDYFVVNYIGENASHPVLHPFYYTAMPLEITEKDLNDKQRALLREALSYGDEREAALLKFLILTRNANSYQDLLN
ncbi:hypothetical protein SteCoe_1766 [Stentor coeruleus]|uniref:Uncharacterized protein n=1 Tax=Stentor coeruleus TaxID=5963 RepID=A0A1R2D0W6_9CILI|nr:hypothetical protein SteCoe_1766 [Stentor coeruleus]